MPNHTTSNDLVAIGRLRRKIESLKKQRDHWKEEYDRLKNILQLSPFIEKRFAD